MSQKKHIARAMTRSLSPKSRLARLTNVGKHRPAQLIQTSILIPGELNSIGDKSASSFDHRCYVMNSCKHGRQQVSTIQSRPVKNIRKVGKKGAEWGKLHQSIYM